MEETIKLRIIKALQTQYKTALVSNGYYFDLGSNVLLLDRYPEKNPMFISIFYGDEQSAAEGSGGYRKSRNTFSFRIEGHINRNLFDVSTLNIVEIIEIIIGDLQKCAAELWSDLPDKIDIVSSGHEDWPEANNTHIGAYIMLEVRYSTVMGNPYTQ